MRKVFAVTAALALLCLGSLAQASITIPTVFVGNAGNANDTTGYGAVAYNYNIGEYDVTAGQYTAFLNAVAATDTYGLYNTYMSYSNTTYDYWGCGITQNGASGSYTYSVADANLPVVDVTFWDACRFANWLDNGQPTGLSEDAATDNGAYTLTSTALANNSVIRNPGATWAVTSENEWYKAAYYDPTLNGGAGGYWEYATRSNTAPTACAPTGAANSANYANAVGNPTDVGAYTGSASAYGTFDQNGNVWNWNESVYYSLCRGLRGGSFDNGYLQASSYGYGYIDPAYVGIEGIGFRVSEVPEPSSVIALLGGVVGLLGMGRRKA